MNCKIQIEVDAEGPVVATSTSRPPGYASYLNQVKNIKTYLEGNHCIGIYIGLLR